MTARERYPVGRVVSALILIGSLLALLWLLVRRDALEVLSGLSPALLAGTVVLQVAYLLPQAYRYWLVLHEAGTEVVAFREWIPVFVIGRLLNSVAPQAGNVYRGVILKRDHGIAYAGYVGAFVGFTWLTTVLNAAVAAVVLAIAEPELVLWKLPAWILLLGLAGALLVAPFGIAALVTRWRPTSRRLAWARGRLEQLLMVSTQLVTHPRLLAHFLLAGMVGLVLAIAIFDMSAASLGVDLTIGTVAVLYVLLQLSTYVNVTPGNLGIQELGFGLVATQLGLPIDVGVLIGLVVRLTGFIALLVAGLGLGGAGAWKSTRRVAGSPTAR